jgi:Mu transposase, C-terminal
MREPPAPASAEEIEGVLARFESASSAAKARAALRYRRVRAIEQALGEGTSLMAAYARGGGSARRDWARVQRFPRPVWEAVCVPTWAEQQHPWFVESVPELGDFLAALILERKGMLAISKVARVGMARFAIDPRHRRAIERYVGFFYKQNRAAILLASEPDRGRSYYEPAHGSMSQGKEPFAVVEFDGSPADVLTLDGRQHVLVAVDQCTGAKVAVVGDVENGDLTARLFARFSARWSYAPVWRTDRGAIGCARVATALERMGGRLERVLPYRGRDKPFAESTVHLIQQFVELESGFCGHDSAERQRLRGRLSMSSRRGRSETVILQVKLTALDLENHLSRFLDLEADRPRDELGGRSTNQAICEWEARGGKLRPVEDDPEALAMLFARTAVVTVSKRGIRFRNRVYIAGALGAIAGHRVELRHCADFDKVAVFTLERTPKFICLAVDRESLNPDVRRAEALAAREAFRVSTRTIRATARKLVRKLDGQSPAEILLSARRPNGETKVVSMPFSTPALVESGKAARAEADLALIQRRDAASEADRKWAYYSELQGRDNSLTDDEQRWLAVYVGTDADYAARVRVERAAS